MLDKFEFNQSFFSILIYKFSDDPKDPMCVKHLARFGLDAVEHSGAEVREAGQELILYLYRYITLNCCFFQRKLKHCIFNITLFIGKIQPRSGEQLKTILKRIEVCAKLLTNSMKSTIPVFELKIRQNIKLLTGMIS